MQIRRDRRAPGLLLAAILVCAPALASAQAPSRVAEARAAFDEADYVTAADLAESALQQQLSLEERVAAYEILGYSQGIMDQPDEAVSTLSEMVLLDPDREPDRIRLPPRIVTLYAQAYEQVLVVRRILVDSASFVSGQGAATLHYEVSQQSVAQIRLIGNGLDVVIDSALVRGAVAIRYDWDAMLEGAPVPAGDYQLIVDASSGRNQYQRAARFTVSHAPVDTLPHSTSLEGWQKRPETQIPPRNWRPMGVSGLLTAGAAAAALALGNSVFDGSRWEIGLGAAFSLGTGLALSLGRPEAQPVPLAIELNRLIDQSLAAENARIADENARRRRNVRVTIVQVTQ